eukprot:jgi/Picsp_1/6181/NSC_03535-R1_predicted protein [Micromonas sp. RCC299]
MSKNVQFKAVTGVSSDQKAAIDETSLFGEAKASNETRIPNKSPGINEIVSSHATNVTGKNGFKACPTYSMPKAPWKSDQSHDSHVTGVLGEIKAVTDIPMILSRNLNRSPELDLKARQGDMHEHGEDGKGRGGVQLLAKSVSISVNGAVQSDENAKKISKCPYTMDRNVSCGLSVAEAEIAKINHVQFLATKRKQSRVFREWWLQWKAKQWKKSLEAKDDQIWYLLQKIEACTKRPFYYFKKTRFRNIFLFWWEYTDYRKNKALQIKSIETKGSKSLCRKVFTEWWVALQYSKSSLMLCNKADKKRCTKLSMKVLGFWKRHVGTRTVEQHKWNRAVQFEHATRQRLALYSFQYQASIASIEIFLFAQTRKRALLESLQHWQRKTQEKKQWSQVISYVDKIGEKKTVLHAFYIWLAILQGNTLKTMLHCNIFALHEMEQLRLDNTRLAKIVDQGVWGEHQIDLLNKAACLLEDEKEALEQVMKQFPWTRDHRIAQKDRIGRKKLQHQISKETTESAMPPETYSDDVFHRLSQPKRLQERSSRREASVPSNNGRKVADALCSSEDRHQGYDILEPMNAENAALDDVNNKKFTAHECSLNPYIGLAISSQGSETSFFKILRHVIENFEGMGFLTKKLLNDSS